MCFGSVRMGFSIEIDEQTREAIRGILSELENPVKITLYGGRFCEWGEVNWCRLVEEFLDIVKELSPENKLVLEKKDISENTELVKLLEPHITSRVRVPVICINDCEIVYMGAPFGEEVRTFLDALLMASKKRTNLRPETRQTLRELVEKLPRRLYIVTLVTQMCPYCPYAASLANSFAVESGGKIVSIIYDASLDPELAEEYGVTMVPAIIMGLEGSKGRLEFIGVPSETDLLERVEEHLRLGR